MLLHHQLLIINKHYLARNRSLHLLLLYYKWPIPINNTSTASHIKDHLLLLTPTSQYCNTQRSSGQIKHELFQCWSKSNKWYTSSQLPQVWADKIKYAKNINARRTRNLTATTRNFQACQHKCIHFIIYYQSRPQIAGFPSVHNVIISRLAKIDLVTIFDCDYRWYCTIDYVIVNYIGIHHLFIIFNDFLAINHLLCIKDNFTQAGSVTQC